MIGNSVGAGLPAMAALNIVLFFRSTSLASQLLQGAGLAEYLAHAIPEHAQGQQWRTQDTAAREGHVRHGAEHVEALAVAGMDRFAQQFRAPVGDVQAMARVALGVEHVRVLAQAPDLGEAVGGDTDLPAPLIVDAYIRQLREDLEHLRAHVGADIRRITPGVMAGPAEQQAPVRREPVVIQADFLVAERQVCLLYTSPSPRDRQKSRMPSSA